jgi:hypothetical protein
MTEEMTSHDLTERLALIETLIAEGRRQTQSWGWTFLLWGIAYCVAIAWASWDQPISILGGRILAWPVTMVAAVALTIVIATRRKEHHPGTTVGRAIGSLWLAIGITMLLLIPALGLSGRLGPNLFVSIVAALLGIANGASALILRWKAQLACAVAWWVTCAAACFCSPAQLVAAFFSTVFLCQIAFGVYAMTLDSRRRSPNRTVHA